MTNAGPSQHSWNDMTTGDNSHQHNGHIYGGVTNNFHRIEKTPAERFLQSLYFPGMDGYQERPLESYEGTYEWLFDEARTIHSCNVCAHILHTSRREWDSKFSICYDAIEYDESLVEQAAKFRSWLSTSQEIFWVSGKAGAGKSCLMKFLLEHPRTANILRGWAGQDVTLSGFYFWAAGGELERSHIGLLRSLLHQILRCNPDLLQRISLSQRDYSGLGPPAWTLKGLREVFRKVLEHAIISTSFVFFIDGLDEFQGDMQDLLGALDTLNQSPKIKICVSSRPWNVFEKAYGSRENKLHLRLHEVNRLDIGAYIRGRLTNDFDVRRTNDAEGGHQVDLLSRAIRDKAEGVFLWVYLAVKSLRGSLANDWTTSEMLKSLNEIPPELEDLLQHLFHNIHAIHLRNAARTFLSILAVKRGIMNLLYIPTICDDIHNDRSLKYSDSRTAVSEMVPKADRAARRWCGDLVNIVRVPTPSDHSSWLQEVEERRLGIDYPYLDYVQFPHRTIRDFIWKRRFELAERAGRDFCPYLAFCSATTQLLRRFRHHPGFLLDQFIENSRSVAASNDARLADLVKSFGAHTQESRHFALAHWAQHSELFEAFEWDMLEIHLVYENASNVIFIANLLSRRAYRLFWLMHDLTTQANIPSIQLWLGALFLVKEPSEVDSEKLGTPKVLSTLLRQGGDLNQPVHSKAKRGSIWQRVLLIYHSGREDIFTPFFPLDENMQLDLLLEHGADPDTDLDVSKLYKFVEVGQRSDILRTLLPHPVNKGDRCSRPFLDLPEREVEIWRSIHGAKQLHIPLCVPATAAFEIQPYASRYKFSAHKSEKIAIFFPRIKAKLIAASEAKARRQRISNEITASKQKRMNGSGAGDQRSIHRLLRRFNLKS